MFLFAFCFFLLSPEFYFLFIVSSGILLEMNKNGLLHVCIRMNSESTSEIGNLFVAHFLHWIHWNDLRFVLNRKMLQFNLIKINEVCVCRCVCVVVHFMCLPINLNDHAYLSFFVAIANDGGVVANAWGNIAHCECPNIGCTFAQKIQFNSNQHKTREYFQFFTNSGKCNLKD